MKPRSTACGIFSRSYCYFCTPERVNVSFFPPKDHCNKPLGAGDKSGKETFAGSDETIIGLDTNTEKLTVYTHFYSIFPPLSKIVPNKSKIICCMSQTRTQWCFISESISVFGQID